MADSPPRGLHAEPTREDEQELTRANRARRIRRHHSLIAHWLHRMVRRPARPALAPLPTVTPGQVGISFAGHATVLIRYAELQIVCDPMLGRWVGAARREVLPGLSPADLHEVELVLISSADRDHLHRATLSKLPRAASVVLPRRTAQRVSDLDFARVVELGVGQSVEHHGVDIITLPVRQGARDTGALSYLIRGDGPSVYFCGSSGYFSGFAEVGRRFQPDIAILPIGGYSPLSFRDRNMTPLDALHALEDLRARILIPIRFGAFALSYERLDDPTRWLADLVRAGDLEEFVVELAPGESRVFVPPRRRDQKPQPGAEATTPEPADARADQDAPDQPADDSIPTPIDDRQRAAAALDPIPIFEAEQPIDAATAARLPTVIDPAPDLDSAPIPIFEESEPRLLRAAGADW